MANNIDAIANVKISLQSPTVDSATFGTILIVGSLPANHESLEKQPEKVGVYAGIKEVSEAGWKETEDVYKAAIVAFSQDPKPDKIIIAPRQLTSGEEEGITATLNRAYEEGGWYGIALVGATDEELNTVATWTEATEKIFMFTTSESTNPIKTSGLLRTAGWHSNGTGEYDKFLHVAIMAKCFNFQPGSETWALKTLAIVNPSKISSTLCAQLDNQNMNYYVTIAGTNVTQTGKMLGDEWIDTIRFRDWLKNDMQLRVFNAMRLNPKLPYTDNGIGVIDGCMIASLTAGTDVGGIREDEFDADGNIIPGFGTNVPLSANLTAAERKKRTLNYCTWHAYLAGAIQVTEIKGTLGY